jgi:hypothetical protein
VNLTGFKEDANVEKEETGGRRQVETARVLGLLRVYDRGQGLAKLNTTERVLVVGESRRSGTV